MLGFYGNWFFSRSSLRFKGHPRPVVRSTENSANPSISEGRLWLQWWHQSCFQKEFLPGPKHWPRLGIHIRRNRVSELHLDILGHNCIQDQNPWRHKKSIVGLSFQIGFLGQDQPSTESAQIFKGCRSDHMGMGLGWTPDVTNPAKWAISVSTSASQ